jgi:hypothetical protein
LSADLFIRDFLNTLDQVFGAFVGRGGELLLPIFEVFGNLLGSNVLNLFGGK